MKIDDGKKGNFYICNLYLQTMNKIVVRIADIDKQIIKKIKENEMITLGMLVPELPEYHKSAVWKSVNMLKRAGIIEVVDRMYKIADGIDVEKIEKTGEITLEPDMLKLADNHIEILKLLSERGKKTKLAFIRHKLNYTFWKAVHTLEELRFLGLVKREKKGIYEITPIGKELIEDGKHTT